MSTSKIGLLSLTALVFSSMVGSGVFSLPQNMAAVANGSALLFAWLITGIGIIFLAFSLLYLTRQRPDLDGGIYNYAREGFGDLIGFCSAWGYWLCTTIGIVGYVVIAFSAVGMFTDTPEHIYFGEGNTLYALIGSSLFVWLVHWLVSRGIKEAALVNLMATIAKIIPLVIFIIFSFVAFKLELFKLNFLDTSLQMPVWQQVRDVMLITLWVFTGIEGAVVLSSRAKKRNDIGKATLLGVLLALAFYVMVTVLAYGINIRSEIAGMHNPSMATILGQLIGIPGTFVITLGLIISVSSSYLSWTLFATEIPYLAAKNGAFPKIFLKTNQNSVPIASLWLTSIVVQLSLIAVCFFNKNYTQLLLISSVMILLPYFLVSAFYLKESIRNKRTKHIVIASIATMYAVWLLYAAGFSLLLLSGIFYALGLLIFFYSRFSLKRSISSLDK
ncbi:basic amino acid/polyamine antiporter [Acinetobacter faecalis]|jgi:arginine:ornithine antiporter/lysine permease|uniref:Basic amino acid/polyamine antiporter n=1 Tax=Acinetobacter faecalis TaxID=2665161 RepID=A0AB35UZK2_9GAMM|nr:MULTISPECIES: basic amino acid/polyamine antiporter [Acinetobacter]MDY6487978.1 basic amino acid/polyamine antiporter [Acinetobacter faecalis]MDY6525180.1 basic amino acid/polyamine antiporter [Acinetobacter faecalis]NWK50385.1 amino acid permease [Acinetobacter sp. SwsAc7]